MLLLFFSKQKTAYELRISDWSSDVCSSDLLRDAFTPPQPPWPRMTMSLTSSWVTANSSAADTPCRPPPVSNGGTRLAMLRTTNISPGPLSKIMVGSTRLSEQGRSAEHTYELQSIMRILYAVFCL